MSEERNALVLLKSIYTDRLNQINELIKEIDKNEQKPSKMPKML
jgi:hypothetical protein